MANINDQQMDRLDKVTSIMAKDFADLKVMLGSALSPEQSARLDQQIKVLEQMGKDNAVLPAVVPPALLSPSVPA